MFKMLKRVVPNSVKNIVKRVLYAYHWDPWQQCSWSQEGEDQILRRIFEGKSTGFYVDIGAHHPKRFSNTYYFYRKGWNGINIDAMPGSMRDFQKTRPRDINLEIGVGCKTETKEYYIFNEPALNGFSKQISNNRDRADNPYKIIDVKNVRIEPLKKIFASNIPNGQKIDFMSIDVEGLDFDVLSSNNWLKYRPKFVLVEVLGSSLHEIEAGDIGHFMTKSGYSVYAKCVNTVFFKERKQ